MRYKEKGCWNDIIKSNGEEGRESKNKCKMRKVKWKEKQIGTQGEREREEERV